MGANVSVLGINSGMGGLKESIAKFRKHHVEVGDALMNISGVGTATGEAVDKDEPRPAYHHEEYPFMLYKPSEEPITVANREDKHAMIALGWRIEPVIKPQVAVLDAATEKKALMDQNKQLQAQISIQSETIAEQKSLTQTLMERLEALEARKK